APLFPVRECLPIDTISDEKKNHFFVVDDFCLLTAGGLISVSPGIYPIQNGFLSRTKAALLRLQLQERDSEGPREPPGTSQSSYNAMTGEQDQL
ncbi:MAG TPA: hypothetical protein PKV86_02320, partial [Syntrophobacteraceae bacterium]|nr:hypothetical protein [Syntrophobacteraceae bacterium]